MCFGVGEGWICWFVFVFIVDFFFFLFDVLLGDVCVLCLLLWELVCTYLESGNRYMFSGYG